MAARVADIARLRMSLSGNGTRSILASFDDAAKEGDTGRTPALAETLQDVCGGTPAPFNGSSNMRLKYALVAGLIAITSTTGFSERMESDARVALERFHEKGNREDLDGLMKYVHDDLIASLANQDLLKGKEAFRKAYATILDAYTNINLSVDIVETRTVGEEVEMMWYTVGQRTNASTGVVQSLRSANMALFKYNKEGQMQFYRLSNHLAAPATQ